MLRVENSIKLSENAIKCIEQNGLSVPKKAVTYSYDVYRKDGRQVDLCTFYDKDNLPVKRLKTTYGDKDGIKEVQTRYYHYLGTEGKNRRLSEINQYKCNAADEHVDATVWRFYHPRKGGIRFSMRSEGEKRDNFVRSTGTVTDKNGFVLRPVSIAEYLDIKWDLGKKNYVGEPWSYKQSKTLKEGTTDSVEECSVVGIVGEKGISLNHLSPCNPDNDKPYCIGATLSEQLKEQGKDAKAFIMGSCEDEYESNVQFQMLKVYLKSRNVKHSEYKTGNKVLYSKMEPLTYKFPEDEKRIKDGLVTPFYYHGGQHIAYKDGEIKLANLLIDEELEKGHCSPEKLIDMSFDKHSEYNKGVKNE